jgi:nicotinamide mononucleotide adenylyltransferase
MPSQDIPFSHRLKTKQEFGSKSNFLKTHLSNDASRSSNTKREIMDRFEQNLEFYLSEINLVESENQDVEITIVKDKLIIFYSIGRCNPPHEGHIQLFISILRKAQEARTSDKTMQVKVIFFLGSGPNGGERTSKDPLDFETKKNVIIYLLGQRGYTYGEDYEIREKDYKQNKISINPTHQMMSYVQTQNVEHSFKNVRSQLIVGDKDGDATKLDYMLKSFNKSVKDKFPDVEVTSNIVAIEPIAIPGSEGVALSATKIRQIAWESTTLDEFIVKTDNFYGDLSNEVYLGINNFKPEPELHTLEASLKLQKPKSRSKVAPKSRSKAPSMSRSKALPKSPSSKSPNSKSPNSKSPNSKSPNSKSPRSPKKHGKSVRFATSKAAGIYKKKKTFKRRHYKQ